MSIDDFSCPVWSGPKPLGLYLFLCVHFEHECRTIAGTIVYVQVVTVGGLR